MECALLYNSNPKHLYRLKYSSSHNHPYQQNAASFVMLYISNKNTQFRLIPLTKVSFDHFLKVNSEWLNAED